MRWPDWTIPKALQLIQGYLDKHRTWPTRDSGRIYEGSPDTWTGLDIALKNGNRGLPGGTTLARFIAETWRVRNRSSPLVEFDLADVLRWCDYHFARTGAWPHVDSGAVAAAPGETWGAINHALSRAVRYMGEPTSLARLLAAHRGVPNIHDQSPLTEEQILAWADLHVVRTGRWPTRTSGADVDAPGENWKNFNYALIRGNRTLTSGSSLARLLAKHRGVRNRRALPPFDVETLLRWADSHRQRTGRWPPVWSGPIVDEPTESWAAVDSAFKQGSRGLANTGYRSLAHLLDNRRRRSPQAGAEA